MEAFPRFGLWACTCAMALVGIGCSTLLGDFRLADNAADTSTPGTTPE